VKTETKYAYSYDTKINFNKFNYLFEEDFYLNSLTFLSKFNSVCSLNHIKITKLCLNFGFKHLDFKYNVMPLHFLILELITAQKGLLTRSKKELPFYKIKKNAVAGCKVTLRKKNIYIFLNSLFFGLTRTPNFKGFHFNILNQNKNYFNINLNNKEISNILEIESEAKSFVKNLNMVFNTNTLTNHQSGFLLNQYKISIIENTFIKRTK